MTRASFTRRGMLGAMLAALPVASMVSAQPARPRIVVIGGGFGGATAARYLRVENPGFDVTMIEPKAEFQTCPFSNYVLAGFKSMRDITHGYDMLTGKHGVRHVRDMAVAIDPVAKTVRVAGGGTIGYDKLIVSPGIDMRWNAIEGYDEAASALLPHAWQAGPQTVLLRQQLEAMPDGGVVVLSIPANPFRCPPGPYERIAMIAHYLKSAKPKSKILALDGKDAFSKQGLFQDAWKELYPGMIEWVPLGQDGRIVQVVAAERILVSDFGQRHKAHVANVIPPQMAGKIARDAGLAATEGGMAGWCPVDPYSFESTRIRDIHVIGDAAIAGAMPKSGFSASSQAKFVARAVAAALTGKAPEAPVFANTCYSLAAPDYGISVADIFRATPNGIVAVQGAGGVSPRNPANAPQFREQEAHYAEGWYASATKEIWGS
jgi:sulfide dehydrogenase [flavocytochrome c] flavoprotein subunit